MQKPKIYLDTSVISHLLHADTPDKMNDTLKLWEQIKQDLYDVAISRLTLDELTAAPEAIRQQLFDLLKEIDYGLIEKSPSAQTLANEYVNNNVLRQKSFDDCVHLAFATVHECDFIASWNFKHIVNIKTMAGVNFVNKRNGYNEIQIVSPTMIVEGED